jgi:tetratricopeptide (TPR) repeat protein
VTTIDYHPGYLLGVLLFNRGDYFEAHEYWEDAWNDAPSSEKDFYKGLIQAAVGLCHLYNGNARGARRLYHSSRSLLERFGSIHQGLDLHHLAETMEQCFVPVVDDEAVDWLPQRTDDFDVHLQLVPEPRQWPDAKEYHSGSSP